MDQTDNSKILQVHSKSCQFVVQCRLKKSFKTDQVISPKNKWFAVLYFGKDVCRGYTSPEIILAMIAKTYE